MYYYLLKTKNHREIVCWFEPVGLVRMDDQIRWNVPSVATNIPRCYWIEGQYSTDLELWTIDFDDKECFELTDQNCIDQAHKNFIPGRNDFGTAMASMQIDSDNYRVVIRTERSYGFDFNQGFGLVPPNQTKRIILGLAGVITQSDHVIAKRMIGESV